MMGQSAAVDHRRGLAAPQTGISPTSMAAPRFSRGSSKLAACVTQPGRSGTSGHDHIQLFPLFVHGVLEHLGNVFRETSATWGFLAHGSALLKVLSADAVILGQLVERLQERV